MSAGTVTSAELDAARLILGRMGITPEDLLRDAADRPQAPTFAEYVPVVSAAVSAGTRRVYGSYSRNLQSATSAPRDRRWWPRYVSGLWRPLAGSFTVRPGTLKAMVCATAMPLDYVRFRAGSVSRTVTRSFPALRGPRGIW